MVSEVAWLLSFNLFAVSLTIFFLVLDLFRMRGASRLLLSIVISTGVALHPILVYYASYESYSIPHFIFILTTFLVNLLVCEAPLAGLVLLGFILISILRFVDRHSSIAINAYQIPFFGRIIRRYENRKLLRRLKRAKLRRKLASAQEALERDFNLVNGDSRQDSLDSTNLPCLFHVHHQLFAEIPHEYLEELQDESLDEEHSSDSTFELVLLHQGEGKKQQCSSVYLSHSSQFEESDPSFHHAAPMHSEKITVVGTMSEIQRDQLKEQEQESLHRLARLQARYRDSTFSQLFKDPEQKHKPSAARKVLAWIGLDSEKEKKESKKENPEHSEHNTPTSDSIPSDQVNVYDNQETLPSSRSIWLKLHRYCAIFFNHLGLMLFLGACCFAIFFTLRIFTVPDTKSDTIPLNVPANLDGMRIVHLSDLHITPLTSKDQLSSIVHRIRQLYPDVVVITGDLVSGNMESLEQYVEPLLHISAPMGVYIVPGSSDYEYDFDQFAVLYKEHNITLLVNQSHSIYYYGSKVNIIGLADDSAPRYGFPGPRISQSEFSPNSVFNLLLSHNPRNARAFIAAAQSRIDLMLSGGTHGGQIPFLRPMYHADQNGFTSGLYELINNTYLYVSNGTGYDPFCPLRIGSKPEISVHIIHSKELPPHKRAHDHQQKILEA